MNTSRCLLHSTVFVLALGTGISGDERKSSPTNDAAAATGREARIYLRHAKDWLETLSFRTEAELPTPKAEAQDLVAAIVRDVQASGKALDRLSAQYVKNVDVLDRLGRIKQQIAKVQVLNARLAAECAKEPRDASTISDGSFESWHELDAAEVETTALLRLLKINRLAPPKPAVASKGGNASTTPMPSSADGTATLGKGFRPRTATAYHRSALDTAGVLSDYGESQGPVPEETVLEHLGDIERQLASLKQEYAKLDDVYRKEKNLEREIKAVEDKQSNAQSYVDRLKKAATTRKLNPTELREVSNLIYQSLRETLIQHYQILDNSGVQHGGWHNEPLYSD